MAFTRAGNRDAFLETSRYGNIQTLQRAIESGTLLQRYDLDTPQNRTRYHKNTAPPLVGGASLAPNTSADLTLDHLAVTPLNPAATSPSYNLGAMLLQYVPLRDCFYHRDKQREVAKGLDDLYKELQRVQSETPPAAHPTIPGSTLVTKRKLTAAEAGKIISQRRYHASRATLEQLAVELGYVGELDITESAVRPYAVPTPPPAVTYRTPSPDAIRATYQQPLSLTNAMQRIPEGVLAVIRDTALVSGVIAGSGLTAGAAIAYGAAKLGQIGAGLAASGISHVARRGAADYITSEDGLQNFAQFTGKVGGLAAYSATASLATATLAVGWVTGTLAGSAVTRYVANRKRQNAREKRSRLENTLQAGGIDAALAAQIQNDVRSAERYEAASAGFDIASLLGLVGGSLYSAFGGTSGSPDTQAPTITRTEFNDGSTTHSFDKATTPTLGFEVDATDDHGIDKITASVYKVGSTHAPQRIEIYPDNAIDHMQHAAGMNTIKDGGEITLANLSPGEYIINATATDNAGNHSLVEQVGRFTVTENGSTPPTPGPHPPSPTPGPHPGPSPIPGTTDYADWDIRRTYDDHGHLDKHCDPSSYKGEAAHENAITFDAATRTGTVQFDLSKGDSHTADIHNIAEDTKVFFEGYKNGKLEDAILVNIDASGKFDLSGLDLHKYDGYQVWWADVNDVDAGSKTLCVEALASYNTDSDPTDCPTRYIVEAEEACHSGSGHGAVGVIPSTPLHLYDCGPVGNFAITLYPDTPAPFDFMLHGSGHGMTYAREIFGADGIMNTYVVSSVGPGANCVFDLSTYPSFLSDTDLFSRVYGVDLGTGTHDVLTYSFHGLNVDAVDMFGRPVSELPPTIDTPAPLPFGMESSVTVAPSHHETALPDTIPDGTATQPLPFGTDDTVVPEETEPSAPLPDAIPPGTEAVPLPFGTDQAANTPYIPEGILYVDDEAIQAFLRSQYEHIDYKNVA